MKILHLLSGGGIGGIEMLCKDIATLSSDQHEFCFLYSGGAIADQMEQKGIPIYRLYTKQLISRLQKLIHLVRERRYNIIIVHHEGIGIYSFYLILKKVFKNIKFIKYLHCAYEEEYFFKGNFLKDKINYRVLAKTIQKSDYLIAVSEYVKNSYQKEFNLPDNRATVIYNGINTEDLNGPLLMKPITKNTTRLLYIGRLVEVKGIRTLFMAIHELVNQGMNIELEILGDGDKRSEYEQLSVELGIQDKVFFRGFQMDKQGYYDDTQIFVYPSIWQEAFGISIVEAMAAGLICVAGRVGGIPEIISDNRDGYLFTSGDTKDLVNVLKKTIHTYREQQSTTMQTAAYERAKQFSINYTIEHLHEICKRIVEDRSND